jgi:hypothetical protein
MENQVESVLQELRKLRSKELPSPDGLWSELWVKLTDVLQTSHSALQPMLTELTKEIAHQKANWSEMHRDCMKAEQALREAQADKPTPPNQRYAELAENRANEIAKLGRENEKLRELLRQIGNTAGRPVAEYYSAEMQRKHFLEIAEEISKLVQQALSPPPTPARKKQCSGTANEITFCVQHNLSVPHYEDGTWMKPIATPDSATPQENKPRLVCKRCGRFDCHLGVVKGVSTCGKPEMAATTGKGEQG